MKRKIEYHAMGLTMLFWAMALLVAVLLLLSSCKWIVEPRPLYVCLVNGDTLTGNPSDSVRCAQFDSLGVQR